MDLGKSNEEKEEEMAKIEEIAQAKTSTGLGHFKEGIKFWGERGTNWSKNKC